MRNERAVLCEDGCGCIVYCLIAFNVMARWLMAVGLVRRMVDINTESSGFAFDLLLDVVERCGFGRYKLLLAGIWLVITPSLTLTSSVWCNKPGQTL